MIVGVLIDMLFKFVNKGLEMVLVMLLIDLVVNEFGKFCFLVDGKFVVGLKVEVVFGG